MRKDTVVLGQLAYVCCGIAVLAMHVPDWRVSNLTAFAAFEQSLTAPPEPDHDKNPHPLQPGGLTSVPYRVCTVLDRLSRQIYTNRSFHGPMSQCCLPRRLCL